mgnify:CR=1 FL=1
MYSSDTESLEEACEDHSDQNARESDEIPCSQRMNDTTTSQSPVEDDKIETEIGEGSAIAEDSPLCKHVKTSIINEISPDDEYNSHSSSKTDNLNGEASLLCCDKSILGIPGEEVLPRSLTPPKNKEQRETGNNYGERPGGSTSALAFKQNGGPNDGPDLVCSGGTTEEVSAPPDRQQRNLSGIGLPSSESADETKMKNSLIVGSSMNGVEEVGQQTLTGPKLLRGAGSREQQSPNSINGDDKMEGDDITAVEKFHKLGNTIILY